jgi:hypothetical protein
MPFGRFVNQGIDTMLAAQRTFSKIAQMPPDSMAFLVEQIGPSLEYSRLGNDAWLRQQTDVLQEVTDRLNGATMVNKNSLDAMFERGCVIQFKTWMGATDYKYVLITNKVAEKKSLEDDVWRVELIVKEIPILSLTPIDDNLEKVNYGWMVRTVDRFGHFVMGMEEMSAQVPALEE